MDKELRKIINSIEFGNIEKHPNILIAARFWDDRRYHAAKVCYQFMRMIDDFIDDRKSRDEEISCLEKEELSEKVKSWIDCLHITDGQDPFYLELADTISTFRIPLEFFHNFARAMLYDINHTGFSTLEDFMEYTEGASVAPASIFVHLCCLSEGEGEYIIPDYNIMDVARPCAVFSYLVHIIRDFQEDQMNNLNYFALDILATHNLLPVHLREIAGGGPIPDSFRQVIAVYCEHAKHYREKTLLQIDELSSKLSGRYLFSLNMIFHLYQMVYERINISQGRFTRTELNPTPSEIRDKVMEVASGWEQG
jgi:phytoene/squalene synthetase